MRRLRALLVRFAGLFRKTRGDAEFASEMESHLEMHIEDNLRAGMTAEEARRQALIRLGGLEQTKERHRERRGLPLFETLVQDLRFATRMLRKNPGFTSVAVLTLALGIGANTAIFGIVNAVILRPLPYRDSGRLVNISTHTAMFPGMGLLVSWPAFQGIRSQSTTLQESALAWSLEMTLSGQAEPEILDVGGVSEDFFAELGQAPEIGRLLTIEDHRPGQRNVLVLSDRLWRTRFAADPGWVGRTLQLDHKIYTIVGVAPRRFSFPEKTDAWIPLDLTAESQQNQKLFAFQFLGKLKRGESLKRLNAELAAIGERFTKDHPELDGSYQLSADSLFEWQVGDSRASYLLLLGAASFVLLIASTNLASLLLARGWARQREMAVRAALGASRGRLVRQGLAESCLLAFLGGVCGTALAAAGIRLYLGIAPQGTVRIDEVAPDWTMLWFALGSSLLAGIFFGLAPARRAARISPQAALKAGSGGQAAGGSHRQSRLGRLLVGAEVAMAFVLLMGSALMTQTLARLIHQDPGFRTERLLTMDLPQPGLVVGPDQQHAREQIERIRDILAEVQKVPGVTTAAAADHGVLNDLKMMHYGLKLEGALPDSSKNDSGISTRYASPGYFKLLGIRLIRGREFTDRDLLGGPQVAVVNETMARDYWGTVDVLGKKLSAANDEKGQPVWSEIVGVVADIRDVLIRAEPGPQYYQPLFQSGVSSHHLLVRTAGDADALGGSITRQIWSRFPEQPVTHRMTMTRTIADSVGDTRLHTMILVVFAAIGLVLALLGVYGVVAYSVAQRTQEIGVRMALGASPGDVLRMIVGQSLVPVSAGIAAGIAGALGMQRAISSELYGVAATDPATFLVSSVLIVLVAVVACWSPARRASRVDPMVALRHE